jgi:hypothetical protein
MVSDDDLIALAGTIEPLAEMRTQFGDRNIHILNVHYISQKSVQVF